MRFALAFLTLCSLAFADASTAFKRCVNTTGQAYIQARDEFLAAPDREFLRREMESDQWRNRFAAVVLNAWLTNSDYYQELAKDGLRPENIKPEARFFAYEILLKSEDREAVENTFGAIDSWVRQGIPIHVEYFLDAIQDSQTSPMQCTMGARILAEVPPTPQGVTIDELFDLAVATQLQLFALQEKMEPKKKAFMEAIRNRLPEEQIAALGQEMQSSAEAEEAQWVWESVQAMSSAIYKRRNTLSEKRKDELIEGYTKRMERHGERGARSVVEFAQTLGGSHAKLLTAKRLASIARNMPVEIDATQDPATPEELSKMMASELRRVEIQAEGYELIDALKGLEANEYLAAFSRSKLGDSRLRQTAMRHLTDLPISDDTFSTLLTVARDTKRDTNERYYALVMFYSLIRKTAKDENHLQIREEILNGFRDLLSEGLDDAILDREVKRYVDRLQE